MTTEQQSQEKIYQQYAWLILFIVCGLLVVNMVIVGMIEDRAAQFQKDTGVARDALMADYPGVPAAYNLNLSLLYVSLAGLASFALAVTWFGFRTGNRWAWFVMWLLPALLIIMFLLMQQSSLPEIGAIYAGFAIAAVIGLLLPIRKFFPGQSQRG